MGNANSVNVAKLVTDIYVGACTNIVQSTKLSNNNTQVISISGTGGDVVISGNVVIQRATLNVQALMEALATQDARQQVSNQIEQVAKSLVSGFNFFTFADAKSTVDNLVKSVTNMTTEISNQCSASLNNNQIITVENTKGDVKILNNLFSQVGSVVARCVENAVSRNTAVQEIQNKIDQASTSELKGFDLAWIVALIALILLLPLVVGGKIAVGAMRYIFPIAMIAGGVMFGVYFATGTEEMLAYYYTKPYFDTCPGAQVERGADTTSMQEAVTDCLKRPSCQLVDGRFTALTADSVPQFTKRQPPLITYYNKICYGDPQQYSQGTSAFPAADTTAVKRTVRTQWLLYVSITLALVGLAGTIITSFMKKKEEE